MAEPHRPELHHAALGVFRAVGRESDESRDVGTRSRSVTGEPVAIDLSGLYSSDRAVSIMIRISVALGCGSIAALFYFLFWLKRQRLLSDFRLFGSETPLPRG